MNQTEFDKIVIRYLGIPYVFVAFVKFVEYRNGAGRFTGMRAKFFSFVFIRTIHDQNSAGFTHTYTCTHICIIYETVESNDGDLIF